MGNTAAIVVKWRCNCTYLVFRSLEEVGIFEVVEIQSGKHSSHRSKMAVAMAAGFHYRFKHDYAVATAGFHFAGNYFFQYF